MSAEAPTELENQAATFDRAQGGGGGRVAEANAAGPCEDHFPGCNAGASDAQILKKVSIRLQEFEAQITMQLLNMQSDFNRKLSYVNRGVSSMKSPDSCSTSTGFDVMTEDLDQLKYEVRELKDLLGSKRSEDFAAATDAAGVELSEPDARADGMHHVITSRTRFEATITAEIAMMKLDIGDIREALQNQDSQMEEVSNTMQQMQAKEESLNEDITGLKKNLGTKVDNVAWEEANQELGAAIKTVRDMVSSLQLSVDAWRCQVGEGSGMVSLALLRQSGSIISTNIADKHGLINSEHCEL